MSELILEVTDLNHYVTRLLQSDSLLASFRLRGEISGFKAYPSGHWYFTLKDRQCAVKCVMFRSSASRMSFRPRDGELVVMHGTVKVYEESGSYQFIADSMRRDGVGDLYQQFEQLKAKLKAEGLFDRERKRPLPVRPRKIAVVTSEAGAVLHDIRKVSAARDPGVPLVLLPVPVQGDGAAPQIAEAIRMAGTLPDVDVMIVGRGGGSMEDLWCFNEEIVARAIAASPVPVISAVGHETDFTIADFVADVRASTPSNAAELAVPDREEISAALRMMQGRFDRAAKAVLQENRLELQRMSERIAAASPVIQIRERRHRAEALRAQLDHLADMRTAELSPRISMASIRLENAADAAMTHHETVLKQLSARLEAASPRRILERGYAMVTAGERVITRKGEACASMTLHFSDGTVNVRREEEETWP